MNHHPPRQFILSILRNIHAVLVLVLVTQGAIADAVWNSSTGGSWLDPAKWSGPVPNAPGDVATLTRSSASTINIDVPSTVTVGEVRIFGPPAFALAGVGPLVFDRPGADPAALNVMSPRVHRVGVAIDIVDGETLAVTATNSATLILEKGFTAGTGDATLNAAGGERIELRDGSPLWDGTLSVNGGTVWVGKVNAFGAGAGTTIVNAGGTLNFTNSQTLNDEQFRLVGGTLTASGSLGINGPIDLAATSNLGGTLTINGPITGAGGLNINSGTISLGGNNAYEGLTTIARRLDERILRTAQRSAHHRHNSLGRTASLGRPHSLRV